VPAFDRVAALPWTQWTYRLDEVLTTTDPDVLDLRATVLSRLPGDPGPATTPVALQVHREATGWRVVREVTTGSRAALWDLAQPTWQRATHGIVVGLGVSRATLRAQARLLDSVVPDVTAVWGSGWSRSAVVVVPRTLDQLARGLGRSAASLRALAAVTTSEGGLPAGSATALRVWLNPTALPSLTPVGRQVVLRHEITHVATSAPGSDTVPLWLEEGYAEYVGYRGSGIPLGIAVGDLLTSPARTREGMALPPDSAFRGANLDIAYEQSYVAASVLADRLGVAGLTELYHRTSQGSAADTDNLASALHDVAGLSVSQLEAATRARVAALTG
jgi:hypothetical protein